MQIIIIIINKKCLKERKTFSTKRKEPQILKTYQAKQNKVQFFLHSNYESSKVVGISDISTKYCADRVEHQSYAGFFENTSMDKHCQLKIGH